MTGASFGSALQVTGPFGSSRSRYLEVWLETRGRWVDVRARGSLPQPFDPRDHLSLLLTLRAFEELVLPQAWAREEQRESARIRRLKDG